jgi:hypothetical protein
VRIPQALLLPLLLLRIVAGQQCPFGLSENSSLIVVAEVRAVLPSFALLAQGEPQLLCYILRNSSAVR